MNMEHVMTTDPVVAARCGDAWFAPTRESLLGSLAFADESESAPTVAASAAEESALGRLLTRLVEWSPFAGPRAMTATV